MSPTTLPARYYTDPGLFREEMESHFCQQWVYVGRAAAIPQPSDYFLCDLAGESLIVVRDTGNAVRAFYNVCRHRGTRMCTGDGGHFDSRIQCPYHGWTYGLDGRLLGAPHMDSGFSHDDYPLHAPHIELWDGHIFVHLGANPKPLVEQLGALRDKFASWRMQDLRLHHRIVYDVKANWKLVISNYSECLHCPLVHPALNQLTDYLGADNEPPQPTYIGGAMGFRDGAETMSMDGTRRRDYLPGLNAGQRKMVCYYAVYPNLLLSLHPDYMMVHTVWPKAVDHTQVVCEWHFHPDELARPGFQADDAIELWDRTNREDWAVVELSQAGIGSRAYSPGPYSPREELLHAFDRMILEREKSR